MTRSGFLRAKRRYLKRARWTAFSTCVVLVCAIIFAAQASKRAGGTLTRTEAVLFFVVLIGSAVVSVASTYRLCRRPEFVCPHCRKSIFQLSAILVATGRCGLCGENILEEEPNKSIQGTRGQHSGP